MSFSIYDEKEAYEAARIRWTWLETFRIRDAHVLRQWAFDAFRVDAFDDTTAWKNCYWIREVSGASASLSWGSLPIDSTDRALVADDLTTYLCRHGGPLGDGRASGLSVTTLVFEGGSEALQMKELWKMARKAMLPTFDSKPQLFAIVVHSDGKSRDLCVPHAHLVHAPRFGIFSMAKRFAGERNKANDVLGTFKRGSDLDRRRFEATAEEVRAAVLAGGEERE